MSVDVCRIDKGKMSFRNDSNNQVKCASERGEVGRGEAIPAPVGLNALLPGPKDPAGLSQGLSGTGGAVTKTWGEAAGHMAMRRDTSPALTSSMGRLRKSLSVKCATRHSRAMACMHGTDHMRACNLPVKVFCEPVAMQLRMKALSIGELGVPAHLSSTTSPF